MSNWIEHQSLLMCLVGLVGLCIGSFLNVVIYRTPKIMMQEWERDSRSFLFPDEPLPDQSVLSLSKPRSTCGHCGYTIKWYDNIPLVSWLLLKGRCRQCKHTITWRYPAIELLTLVLSVWVCWHFGPTWQMVGALVFTWVLIALAFIDFDTQLLPDRITLPLAGLGLLVNTQHVFVSPEQSIWGYVLGFMSLWLVYKVFKWITGKEGMGYGDFKLLAALGAWLGAGMLPFIVIASSFVGAVIGSVLLWVKKENQPFAFGPYLAIAGWIAMMWGTEVMQWYLNTLRG